MDFGEKLKALRTERGLTQEQLAARLYVSRTAVSKWETGGGSPNLDSLQAVAPCSTCRWTTSSYIVFATSRAVAALFTFLFKYGIKGE